MGKRKWERERESTDKRVLPWVTPQQFSGKGASAGLGQKYLSATSLPPHSHTHTHTHKHTHSHTHMHALSFTLSFSNTHTYTDSIGTGTLKKEGTFRHTQYHTC